MRFKIHMHRKAQLDKRRLALAASPAIAIFFAMSHPAHAADVTWVGNTNANFNTGTNWSTTPAIPAASSTLVFGSAGSSGTTLNNDITAGTVFAGFTFNVGASAYTIGGNAIVNTGNITNNSGSLQTINTNLTNLTTAFAVAGAGDVTLGGTVSRNGTFAPSITMNGTGTLTLNGATSFNLGNNAGNLVVNSGTLMLSKSAAGAISAPLIINGGTVKQGAANQLLHTVNGGNRGGITLNGGTFDLNGFNTGTAGAVTSGIAGLRGTGGQIVNNTGSTSTLNILNVGSGVVNHSYGGTIKDGSSAIALAVTSGGSSIFQVLSGNNAYTGGTTLSSAANTVGTLSIADMRNIGSSGSRNLTFDAASTAGSYLQITGTAITNSSAFNSITFNAGKSVGFDIADSTNTFTLGTAVNSGASGVLNKRGAGTLVLAEAANYTGATNINGGTLKVDYAAGGSLNSATAPGFSGGGTLYLSGNATQQLGNVTVNAGGGNIVVDGTGSTLTLGTVAAPTAAGSTLDIKLIGTGNTVTTTTTSVTNGLLGSGRITFRDNAGNIDFAGISASGANRTIQTASYTGGTLPASGSTSTLNYSHTGNASVTTSESVNALKLTTSAASQALTIDPGQTLTLTSGGLLFTGANDYSITGGTLKSNTATNSDLIVHQYGTGNLSIDSVIANGVGASTLTKAGTGTLTLSGINTYTGQTYVNGGILSISNNNQLGAVATGATLNLNGGTLQATASVSLDNAGSNRRAVAIGSGGGGFDVTASNTLTVTGAISAGGELTKSGTGTLVLGAANTLTGGVRIEDGTLRLGLASALDTNGATSALVFGNSGTPTLQLNGFNTSATSLVGSSNAVVENAGVAAATISVYNGADNTFAGTIRNGGTGTLALAKTGGGTLTLSGTNTHTGNTTLLGGTLALGNVNAIQNSTLDTGSSGAQAVTFTVAGANTYNIGGLTGADDLAIGNNTISLGANNASTSYTGNISGTGGGLTKVGNGTLTLSGANAYTGTTTVNAGTLALGFGTVASDILSTSSALTLGGGTLQLTGTGTQTVNGLTTTANTGSRILLGANQTLTLGALTSAGANSSLNFNTVAGGANATTPAVGTGIVVLTGQTAGSAINSGFTVSDAGGFGLATVNGSDQVIRLTSTTLLPASGATSANDYSVNNNLGGPAAAGSSNLAVTASSSAKSITVDTTARNGVLTLNSGVVLSNNIWNFGGVGSNTYQITGSTSGAGLQSVASNDAININNYNTGLVTIASPILANGSNAVNINGTGTLKLSGANTYTGTTTLGSGTLQVGVASVGSVGSITSSAVGTGTLALNGGTISSDSTTARTLLNAVTFGGDVTLGNATNNGALTFSANADLGGATRTLTAASAATFGGNISNGGLIKAGAGTMTLTGANTYNGGTTVSAGTLTTSGAGTLGASTNALTINGGTVSMGSNQTVGAFTMSSGTLGGSGNTLSLPGTAYISGGTLSSGVIVSSDAVWINNSPTLSGTFNVGSGGITIDTAPSGSSVDIRATLSANQTWNLSTTGASAGRINLVSLVTNGNTLTVNPGGTSGSKTFDVKGTTTFDSNVTFGAIPTFYVSNGATATFNGTNNAMSGITTFNGTINAAYLGNNGQNSSIGTGGITLSPGALVYTGSTAATDRNFNRGSLSGTGDASFTVSNAASTLTVSGNLTQTAGTNTTGGGWSLGGAGNIVINGAIQNSSAGAGVTVTKTGAGTLTLTNTNAYTGATTVNGGTLALGFGAVASNIINTSSALTLGGGTLQLTGTGTQTVNGLTTTANTGSRILLAANETLTLGALTSAGANSALNFNTVAGGANATTPAVGTGIVVLTGQTPGNAINSGFTVSDAGGFGLATVDGSNQVIRLTSTTLLPASGATSGNDYLIDNNGGGSAADGSSSLAVTASSAAKSITVDTTTASGTLTLNSGVVLSNNIWNFGGVGSNTYQITGNTSGAGLKSVASGDAINFNNYNTGVVTIDSPILANGTNAVNINGTGTLVFSGVNTYTGVTTISGGTLSVGSIGNGGVAGNLGQATNAATNIIFKGGTLQYTGANATSNRAFTINAGTTATIDTANNISFAGATGTATTGALTKTGAGTLTLDGANTYTGATNVDAGKLLVTTSLGASAVTVQNAGTILATDAAASFGGRLTIKDGAILAVGDAANASTATATVTGGTTFENDSIFSWDINSTGTAYDRVITSNVLGEVTPGNATFRIVVGDDTFADTFWDTQQTWTDIFTTDGTTAISGWNDIFTIDVVNSSFGSISPVNGSFTFNGTTLEWNAVPEPTSALAGLLITAGLLRRRRVGVSVSAARPGASVNQ